VVNTHLYGLHVGSGGAILPEHDVVVFDEAHVLEDIMSDTVGVQIAPGRFVTVGATVRRFLDDPQLVGAITDLASLLREAFATYANQRLSTPLPDPIVEALAEAQLRLTRVGEAIQKIETSVEDAQQRKLRAQRIVTRTMESVEAALAGGRRHGAVRVGDPDSPRLEIAPLDVGPTMAAGVWQERTAILTSATIPTSLARRVGLPDDRTSDGDVGSPFDYEQQASCTARCTCRRRSRRSSATPSPRSWSR
jgi:ATP-dependent DNA helicase DinG